MYSVELTTEELEILRELLRSKIAELNVEAFRTDTHTFKEMLKRRRELLEHLLTKVSNVPIAV